jgi:hypothetical protein
LKYCFIALLTIISLTIIFTNLNSDSMKVTPGQFLLQNILNDEKKIFQSDGNQIFFIETHLNEFRELKNTRQACSVESAGNN